MDALWKAIEMEKAKARDPSLSKIERAETLRVSRAISPGGYWCGWCTHDGHRTLRHPSSVLSWAAAFGVAAQQLVCCTHILRLIYHCPQACGSFHWSWLC